MNADVAIVGIGETPPIRKSGREARHLAIDAACVAIEDSGIPVKEIDGIVSDSVRTPQIAPTDWLGAQLGITRRWSGNTSAGGAANMQMAALAAAAIQTGKANVVLGYYAYDGGSREGGPYSYHARYPAKRFFELPYGFVGQAGYFALWARQYVELYPRAVDALAELAIVSSHHAAATGCAQRPKPLTRADYDNSPLIAEPLRVRDCCVISDGAGAFIMTSRARAKDCRKRPVHVLGTGFSAPPISPDAAFTQWHDMVTIPGATEAATRAFAMAGLTPNDISFAQVYDCFTISLLIQLEDLGFCKKGEASEFVLSGATRIGGKLPVNTHGGFLSYSYRLGIEHIVEAVRQLRGEAGARQVQNAETGFLSGLSMPDFGAMILARG